MLRRLLRILLLTPFAFLASVLAWSGLAHLRFVQYSRRHGLPVPRLGVAGAAAFYAGSCRSALEVVGWVAAHLLGDRFRRGDRGDSAPPVLCVHGFHLVGATLWGLRRALERRGRDTMALFLGLPYREPHCYVRALRRGMHRLSARSADGSFDVVAHSMGGLVLRMVLAADPALARRVRRVVTLGTPHHGTALLRFWRRGPVYRMMSVEAELLRTLPTIGASAPQAEVTTIASRHDFIVYPTDNGHLEDARQVTLEDVTHLGLLTDPRVHELVADLLAGEPAERRGGEENQAAADHREGVEGVGVPAPVRRRGAALASLAPLAIAFASIPAWGADAGQPPSVRPGAVVRWPLAGAVACTMEGRRWSPLDGACWYPVDLEAPPGELQLGASDGRSLRTLDVRVEAYPYPTERLTVAPSTVDLSPADQARVERESARTAVLWQRAETPRRFALPLAPPLERMPVGGRFGARRVFNDQPRSPHSGVDYSVPTGTPVHAVADGTVVLAGDLFFSGRSVFVDHGDGLFSMSFHLSRADVVEGQQVRRGERIGLVGATGRVTGPHLHFAVRWHGARVDPRLLFAPGEATTVGVALFASGFEAAGEWD